MAILMVHAATTSEETVDDFNLTPPYSQMEGRVAVLETHTHTIRHVCTLKIHPPSIKFYYELFVQIYFSDFRFLFTSLKPKSKLIYEDADVDLQENNKMCYI